MNLGQPKTARKLTRFTSGGAKRVRADQAVVDDFDVDENSPPQQQQQQQQQLSDQSHQQQKGGGKSISSSSSPSVHIVPPSSSSSSSSKDELLPTINPSKPPPRPLAASSPRQPLRSLAPQSQPPRLSSANNNALNGSLLINSTINASAVSDQTQGDSDEAVMINDKHMLLATKDLDDLLKGPVKPVKALDVKNMVIPAFGSKRQAAPAAPAPAPTAPIALAVAPRSVPVTPKQTPGLKPGALATISTRRTPARPDPAPTPTSKPAALVPSVSSSSVKGGDGITDNSTPFHKVQGGNGEVYQVISKLGAGGGGSVYKVVREKDARMFAMKLVLAKEDAATRACFTKEVKILTHLRGVFDRAEKELGEASRALHEAKKAVAAAASGSDRSAAQAQELAARARYDSKMAVARRARTVCRLTRSGDGPEGGRFMMEFGEETLDKVLKDKYRVICESQLRVYWREMLEAVDFVHSQAVLHTDLKPANLMLVKGQLKVIDFGIALHLDSNGNARRERAMGTPNYMAPEAWHGGADARPMTTAADVWSLGCILHQMWYGNAPFNKFKIVKADVPAGSMSRAQAVALYEPPLAEMSPRGPVSETARSVISACLRKRPEERPTIAELLKHPWLHPGN